MGLSTHENRKLLIIIAHKSYALIQQNEKWKSRLYFAKSGNKSSEVVKTYCTKTVSKRKGKATVSVQPTLIPSVPAWVNRCREMAAAVKGWPLSD